MWTAISNGFIGAINFMIDNIVSVVSWILLLLPDSPFVLMESWDNPYICYLNYMIPIAPALTHLTLYLSAATMWYGIRIVTKWIKIGSDG